MRGLALLLCAAMLLSGCRSWNVNLFSVPVHRSESTAAARTVGYEAPLQASEFGDLSGDEKAGVILVVAIALAAIAAGIIVAAS